MMPSHTHDHPPLIGAHTSTQGGVHRALIHGQSIGATTVQLFTSNQRQWKGRVLTQAELDQWHHTWENTSIQQIMSHANYLINLGSNNETLLHKSRTAFKEEIERCLALKISYLNFHPGCATGASPTACLERIVQSLREFEAYFQKGSDLRLLIETTAGQGSTVGHTFEQLAYIISQVTNRIPIGVCIDTCHIFAAGYDIRTPANWDEVLAKFDTTIGLPYLYALHLNDSIYPLGARKDRHENLGKGTIGSTSFKTILQHPKLYHLPKYLETPHGETMWKEEIKRLRDYMFERHGCL